MTFLTSDFSDSLYIIPQQILEGVNKPSLAAVPFFIMAGNLMNVVGMTDRIFNFANALVGHFKAGLAQVNVLSSMIFAGVSGAAVADCAGLGAIEIKAMKERGYKPEFAAAVTVCSAVVGPIIPPSIGLVIFAFVAMDIATPEPNNPKKNDVVGKIYDQEIKRDQFMSSYYSVTLDYTMRSGQELRITDQIHKEITGAAWERLAILFKAKANNISVSDDTIRIRIKEIIRMISQSDYYDPSIYSAFISNFLYPRYGCLLYTSDAADE